MLDLQPGVHFHEEEFVGAFARHDELHRAGTGIGNGQRGVHRCLPHPLADPFAVGLIGQQWGRGLLDDLLVPPLQAAFPLAQMDRVAVRVGQHLDLDMPGVGNKPLDQQCVITECGERLPAGGFHRRRQRVDLGHHPHALTAATGRWLEQHRKADLPDGGNDVLIGHSRFGAAWNDRNTGLGDQSLRPDLVTHRLDRGCRRSDKNQPGLGACGGEPGVLGQETVTGVNSLGSGFPGSVEDALYRQVAFPGRGRADQDRLIGCLDMACTGVGVAVDRDRTDPHPAQRRRDPDRDLAAVGDQNRVEHRGHIRKMP